jgi:hypothetical protein
VSDLDAEIIEFPGVQPREQYVTTRELMKEMRISESTVRRWVKEGMPCETWGLRCLRFLPSQVQAWARDRQRGAA